MIFNYLDIFDSNFMKYGKICRKNHNHGDNHSIRYIKNNQCIQCVREYQREIFNNKKRSEIVIYQPNILNINYLEIFDPNIMSFEKLCKKGHDHKDGMSIRYKEEDRIGYCIQCKKEFYHISMLDPKNRERKRKRSKEYYAKDEVQIKIKGYRQHPETKKQRNLNAQNKRKEDPQFRLNSLIRKGIWKSLHGHKNGRAVWEIITQYSYLDLERHLNSLFPIGLSISSFGNGYDLDHIIPQSWFNFSTDTDEEFHLCWALKNLQPLESYQNRSVKHNKYCGSPKCIIMTKGSFKEEIKKRPIKDVCSDIWNKYYTNYFTLL